jgi:hypothetical protein
MIVYFLLIFYFIFNAPPRRSPSSETGLQLNCTLRVPLIGIFYYFTSLKTLAGCLHFGQTAGGCSP